MTDPSVAGPPPYGSAESYANILRPVRPEFLDTSALAIVKVIADDPYVSSGDRVARILAVVAAVEQLRAANEADLSGMACSRPADDPQPSAGRIPPHLEDGRTGATVSPDVDV